MADRCSPAPPRDAQNVINLDIAIEHKSNWQDWGAKWARRTLFLKHLKTVLHELEVGYSLPVQPIVLPAGSENLQQFASSASASPRSPSPLCLEIDRTDRLTVPSSRQTSSRAGTTRSATQAATAARSAPRPTPAPPLSASPCRLPFPPARPLRSHRLTTCASRSLACRTSSASGGGPRPSLSVQTAGFR